MQRHWRRRRPRTEEESGRQVEEASQEEVAPGGVHDTRRAQGSASAYLRLLDKAMH